MKTGDSRRMGTPACAAFVLATVLALPGPAAADPSIEFTHVPGYKTTENLVGRVGGVEPDSFKVAVYIFVEGAAWWTKPTLAEPLTPIGPDSTWTCDVTTGGSDIFATEMRAYLWPDGLPAFIATGAEFLPEWMDTLPSVRVVRTEGRPSVDFAGHRWWVKGSAGLVGPGPNYFSDSPENAWVDSAGALHLRITHSGGLWYCPEVVCSSGFGPGRYVFQVPSFVGRLDRNVVLGLFTWDNHGRPNHGEIDVEFSTWGEVSDSNAQYVIQPWDTPGNRHRWCLPPDIDSSTHSFDWCADSIRLLSVTGLQTMPPYDSVIHTWLYTGPDIPEPAGEQPRLNLWLYNGTPPSDTQEVEVVLSWFEFIEPTGADERPSLSPSHREHWLFVPGVVAAGAATTARLSLDSPVQVRLAVYDASGRLVLDMLNAPMAAGAHEVSVLRPGMAAGTYFVLLRAGPRVEADRLVLID